MNNPPNFLSPDDTRWSSDIPLYNSAMAFKNKLSSHYKTNRELDISFEYGKRYLKEFENSSPSASNKLLLYCIFTGYCCETIFKNWYVENSKIKEVIGFLEKALNIFKKNGFIIKYDFIYYLHFNLANILLLSSDNSSDNTDDSLKNLDRVRKVVANLAKPPLKGRFTSKSPNVIFRNCQLWILSAKTYEVSYRNKTGNFFINVTKCQEWIENISKVFLSSYLNRLRPNDIFRFFDEETWNKFDFYSLKKNRSIKRYSDYTKANYSVFFNSVANFCRDLLHRTANLMIHLGYFELSEHIFSLIQKFPIDKATEYKILSDISIMVLENTNLYRAITELEKVRTDLNNPKIRRLLDKSTLNRLPTIENKIQILKSHFGLIPVDHTGNNNNLYTKKKVIDLSQNEDNLSKDIIPDFNHEHLDSVLCHNYPFEILYAYEKFSYLILKNPDWIDNSTKKHYIKKLRVLINKWTKKYRKPNAWKLKDFPAFSDTIPLNVYQSNLITKYLFELAQMFHPARCPRLFIKLIRFKIYFNDKLNKDDQFWADWYYLAIGWSSKLGEIYSLFSAYELAKSYDENLLSPKFYKTLISHIEFVDSKIEWGYNLADFINKSYHILVDASFYLANNSKNDSEWIFRAIELFKSRFLLSIRRNVKFKENPIVKDLYEISLKEFFISAGMQSNENIRDLQKSKEIIIEGLQNDPDSDDIYYDTGTTWIKPIVSKINKFHHDKKISIVSLTTDSKGQHLLAIIIDNMGLKETVLIDPKIPIMDLVKACWVDITQKSNTQYSALSYLHKVVIKPILKFFLNSEIVYFSFDESTLNLPIHSAFSKEENKFFIQNQRIAYIPSVKLLSYLLSYNRYKATNILIECSQAAGGLNHKNDLRQITQPISNYTISKLDEVNYNSIVYLSGHGTQTTEFLYEYLNADEIKESSLNKLSAKDILELDNDVRCQLFFLNSCSLGLDKQFLRESIGFSFAIMARRAQSCILAAAPVQTNFAQFYAKEFFSQLFNNVDIHIIMQKIINGLPEKWKHPFFWAPYILIGDYRKILH